jgi:quercetin dioxygenase-like cupin family protein
MRTMLAPVVMLTVIIGGLFQLAATVRATPASGFAGTTLAVGRFEEFSVFNKLVPPDFWKSSREQEVWLSWQRTVGQSDMYVQSNVWQPGGTTGWHTHPGHSLIIVTEGAVTAYEADDPACQPTVYTPGMGFVDPGDEHVHNLRNEGAVVAKTIAVQLIPAGATRRIDAPNPGNCPF